MNDEGRMAHPFPAPPRLVASLLDELRLAARATDETEHEARRVAVLERPWDPAACSPELRRNIYAWLDQVVAWINEELTWRTDKIIPTCWDHHPHIVHELAAVACLRWEVSLARTPTPIEEWHRYTLPAFLTRLIERVGETGCPPDRHRPSPAMSRNILYREPGEAARRRRHRTRDAETDAASA